MRCRSRFQCCCHKQEGERILVSKEIAPDEICVRCLLRPLMKQNNTKLRNTTVLPPKSERGVSVLRLRYCDEEFAVKHGKSLKVGNNVFWGLAEFTQKIVDSTNNWAQSDLSKADGIEGVNGIEAHIEYKPMADGEYVNVEKDVFLDDPDIDLPMHAELIYPMNYTQEVQTRLRNYANELIKRIKYNLVDDSGNLTEWLQSEQFEKYNA